MYRLSLRYKDTELCSRDDPTDDPVVAIYNCRLFAAEVLPILKTLPQYRRVQEGDLEKRTTLVDAQLPLPISTNGRHK